MNETPAARKTDPCTSHEAAEQHTASGKRASERQRVLIALRDHAAGSANGITSDELAMAAGIDRHVVGRRLPELRTSGEAVVRGYPESPERRPSRVSGKTAMVWRPARQR